MRKIFFWISHNKLATLLILILAGIVLKNAVSGRMLSYSTSKSYSDSYSGISPLSAPAAGGIGGLSNMIQEKEYTPVTDATRVVIQNSYLSLLVKDVRASSDQILAYTKQIGGFMVNTYFNNPGESPSGTITVRIPTKDLNTSLKYFRDLSIRVVSENLEGEDVTDQFVDNTARRDTLNKTKAKFEDILEKATKVEDILNVEQQIINIQSQIDAIQGQLQYMQKSADYTRVTIYLSTDEYSLPYAPQDAWRPAVIFKEAVRAMIGTVRGVGSAIIWVVVYGAIWIPALIILLVVKKKMNKNNR